MSAARNDSSSEFEQSRPDIDLPSGYSLHWSKKRNQWYIFNAKSGQSQWINEWLEEKMPVRPRQQVVSTLSFHLFCWKTLFGGHISVSMTYQ